MENWGETRMRLLDTNIFLELILEQKKSQEVRDLLLQFKLDFDDAYQYVAAEKYGLTLVSFDADFDRTRLGRKTPEEVLRT